MQSPAFSTHPVFSFFLFFPFRSILHRTFQKFCFVSFRALSSQHRFTRKTAAKKLLPQTLPSSSKDKAAAAAAFYFCPTTIFRMQLQVPLHQNCMFILPESRSHKKEEKKTSSFSVVHLLCRSTRSSPLVFVPYKNIYDCLSFCRFLGLIPQCYFFQFQLCKNNIN